MGELDLLQCEVNSVSCFSCLAQSSVMIHMSFAYCDIHSNFENLKLLTTCYLVEMLSTLKSKQTFQYI